MSKYTVLSWDWNFSQPEKGVKKKEEGKAGVNPVLLDWNQQLTVGGQIGETDVRYECLCQVHRHTYIS